MLSVRGVVALVLAATCYAIVVGGFLLSDDQILRVGGKSFRPVPLPSGGRSVFDRYVVGLALVLISVDFLSAKRISSRLRLVRVCTIIALLASSFGERAHREGYTLAF
jgi:hypothetical protein